MCAGGPLDQCLKLGAVCASEVIAHYGARPEADLKALVAGSRDKGADRLRRGADRLRGELPAQYGQSYPINKSALARIDGSNRTWFIRPSPKWRFWDWSRRAEALHGINREIAAREGLPPEQVLAELAEVAGDCRSSPMQSRCPIGWKCWPARVGASVPDYGALSGRTLGRARPPAKSSRRWPKPRRACHALNMSRA